MKRSILFVFCYLIGSLLCAVEEKQEEKKALTAQELRKIIDENYDEVRALVDEKKEKESFSEALNDKEVLNDKDQQKVAPVVGSKEKKEDVPLLELEEKKIEAVKVPDASDRVKDVEALKVEEALAVSESEKIPTLAIEEEKTGSGLMNHIKDDLNREDGDGMIEDSAEVAAGAGAGALATALLLTSKGKEIVESAKNIKDIIKYGEKKNVEGYESPSSLKKDIELQKRLLDERKEQAERKISTYDRAGSDDKKNKWAGRLQKINDQERDLAEQKRLQASLDEYSVSKTLTPEQKTALAKEAFDQQKALTKAGYEQEKKQLYSRLKKYDDKPVGSLTAKQVTKKARTEQMLGDIADRERQLEGKRPLTKATNAKEAMKNIDRHASTIDLEVKKGGAAGAGIMDELRVKKLPMAKRR